MSSAVANDIFLVPLRHLSSPVYSNEQVLTENTVRGLSSFVGDAENELLKYLDSDQSFRNSDWPLVFFGPTGTGKTSLALSVISKLTDENIDSVGVDGTRSAKPSIFTASDFTRRFNSAIETNSVHDFRNRIADSSALLIDNIQLLADRQHVQDELIIILDKMCDKGIPVILTCHQPPHSIPRLSVQLTSRLTNGLSLFVRPPGPAARRELIKNLMQIHRLTISDDAIDWLSTRLQLTVPKINQFMSQLRLSAANRTTVKMNVEFFEQLFTQRSNQKLIFDNSRYIINWVANQFHLKPSELQSNSRKQSVVMARGVAIYLCREQLNASFKKIGSWFGRRDHSTIMHSYRKTKAIVESDANSIVTKTVCGMQNRLLEQFSGQLDLSVTNVKNPSANR